MRGEIITPDGISWVTTAKAAEAAGVVTQTIRRWAKDGLIECLRRQAAVPGKQAKPRLYVRIDQIRRLMMRLPVVVRPPSYDGAAGLRAFDAAFKPRRKGG